MSTCKKSEPRPLPHIIHKNQLNIWSTYLTVRAETMTPPEDEIGENLCDGAKTS